MRQTDKISFGLKTFLLLTLYFLWLEIAIPFKISVFKVFLLISVVLFCEIYIRRKVYDKR